jgi:hypothetical protein
VAERPLCSRLNGKGANLLSSPRPLGKSSDREVLDFLHRALSDIQRTNARTLATVSDSYDLIRLVEKLSGPLYPSADDGN